MEILGFRDINLQLSLHIRVRTFRYLINAQMKKLMRGYEVMLRIILFIFLLIILHVQYGHSQACCSAGTPLLRSLDVGTITGKTWNFSLTYEYNFLDDVLSGSKSIEGRRQRLSQSVLLETSYGLNDRWSLSSIISFVQQQRKLNSDNSEGSQEELTTRGLGDAVALIKYNMIPLNILSQRQLAVGAGLKIPSGKSDLKLNGILLPADMQPGTGAWDGILWAYFYQGFLPTTRLNMFANASYRFTGKNNRFQLSDTKFKGYKFGNEFVFTTGVAYRTDNFFDFSLLARFRNVGPDEFASSEVANTGGNWLYIVPGINTNFNSFTIRMAGQIPIYRDLQGVQLSTTYTASVSLFYTSPK